LFGRVIQSERISEKEFKTRVAFIDMSEQTKNILEKMIDQGHFSGATTE